jgi:hypothetical protein
MSEWPARDRTGRGRRRAIVIAVGTTLAASGGVAVVAARGGTGPPSPSASATAGSAPAASQTPARPATSAARLPRRPPPAVASSEIRRPVAEGDWPGPGNTGLRAGTRLTVRGPIVVRANGAVLSNLDVRGDIVVQADNVTIRNTRVVNTDRSDWGILQREGISGLTVLDSEVRGNGHDELGAGILNEGGMLTVRRVEISAISDGIDSNQGLIEDSYIHDPKEFPGNHIDLVSALDGPRPGMSFVIRHNTLLNSVGQTSAVALFQDFGLVHDIRVEQNLLAGGGYTVYGGGGRFGTPYNVRITGNVFSRRLFPKGGYYGTNTAFVSHGHGNVWRDNVWEDTHAAVEPT